MADNLHIAFVAQMAPYVKTGGLADVFGALPKALAALGHRSPFSFPVRVDPVPAGQFPGSVHVPLDASPQRGLLSDGAGAGRVVSSTTRPSSTATALDGDYPDNGLRFAFFARAALEFFRTRGERPDVFHAHDWQAGLVPVYLKSFYWRRPHALRLPTVFTIHNVAYQGNFAADTVGLLGLPWHLGRGRASSSTAASAS